MKVTILIPIFNEENTIINLLKRVNNQKNGLADLEIIIVDDCSTDNSKKLLKENPELYSQLIELGKNLGKGGAVREGLKHSEGDYIMTVGERVRTKSGVEGEIVEDYGNMVVIIDDHAETDDDLLEFKKSELEII